MNLFLAFTLKTTGLQFGYFFGLLFAILFLVRGIKNERLSDKLMAMVMFFLSMEVQDYTFGFAGINVLWEELSGLPRHFPWIFPATVYFYLKAQTNSDFTFKRKDFWHVLPYLIYVIACLILWSQGLTDRNGVYKTQLGKFFWAFIFVLNWVGTFYYFLKALKTYRAYSLWTLDAFSNQEKVSLVWLRNFIYLFIAGAILHFINSIVDLVYQLPYEHDYYWQLFTVFFIIYLGITGYTQQQNIMFNWKSETSEEAETETEKVEVAKTPTYDHEGLINKLMNFMEEERPYLQPELSLKQVADHLKTNTSALSAIINGHFGKNFNDFVNEYRVKAFESSINDAKNKHLTLIAIAYDSGFNSKATFNRAVKKVLGKSPSELMNNVR